MRTFNENPCSSSLRFYHCHIFLCFIRAFVLCPRMVVVFSYCILRTFLIDLVSTTFRLNRIWTLACRRQWLTTDNSEIFALRPLDCFLSSANRISCKIIYRSSNMNVSKMAYFGHYLQFFHNSLPFLLNNNKVLAILTPFNEQQFSFIQFLFSFHLLRKDKNLIIKGENEPEWKN